MLSGMIELKGQRVKNRERRGEEREENCIALLELVLHQYITSLDIWLCLDVDIRCTMNSCP